MSKPRLSWMPFYVADYLADTGHLTAEEHGAYLLLIFHYFLQKGLPEEDGQLCRIARVSPHKWKKIKPVIKPFFQPGWKHRRIDAEILKSKEKYEKRAAAGRKGGRIKSMRYNGPFSVIDGGSNV